MRLEEALTSCAEAVRQHDPDRYLAGLFIPGPSRPLIFALYAFNHEMARLGEHSREPMLAAVRLQWWRETVEMAANGRPRELPVAVALAELFARAAPPLQLFSAMLDAREFDFAPETFSDLSALEAYCEATSSGLMKIAAHILGARADEYLRHAGIAYALAGLLRSIPFHAVRRMVFLPRDLLAAEGLDPESVYSRSGSRALGQILQRLGVCAKEHLAQANGLAAPRSARVAALPAALVGLYLKALTHSGFDSDRRQETPLYRRQLTLLRAAISGRL